MGISQKMGAALFLFVLISSSHVGIYTAYRAREEIMFECNGVFIYTIFMFLFCFAASAAFAALCEGFVVGLFLLCYNRVSILLS